MVGDFFSLIDIFRCADKRDFTGLPISLSIMHFECH